MGQTEELKDGKCNQLFKWWLLQEYGFKEKSL